MSVESSAFSFSPLDLPLPACHSTVHYLFSLSSVISRLLELGSVVINDLMHLLSHHADRDVRQPSDKLIGEDGHPLLLSHCTSLHSYKGGPHLLLKISVVNLPILYPEFEIQCWKPISWKLLWRLRGELQVIADAVHCSQAYPGHPHVARLIQLIILFLS